MPGDFKHLELILQRSGKKQHRKGSFPIPPETVTFNKRNKENHSTNLFNKASRQIEIWDMQEQRRIEAQLPELPIDKPLLIKIPPEEIDLDYLRTTMNFEVICEYEDGLVIVATDPEKFNETLQKITDFATGIRGTGNIAKLYDIVAEESLDERLRRVLSTEIYSMWHELINEPEKIVIVEASIECLGTITVPQKPDKTENEDDKHFQSRIERWEAKMRTAYEEWDNLCRNRQAEIDRFINDYNGEVLEIYDYIDDMSPLDTFELKLKVPVKCLRDFAENYPYVFEIAFPEDFNIEVFRGQLDIALHLDFELHEPDENAPTVCVIDSGIQEGHVYINQAIKTDLSKCYLTDRTNVDDEVDEGGHGTRVAGAVLYPHGISNMRGDYILPCYIANAKVLDENNSMPETLLPSKVLSKIVKDYYDENSIRLFNHSISASSPCRTKYMSSWAAAIDNISFEKDVLIMQASGNIWSDFDTPIIRGIMQHLDSGKEYPQYLIESSCRIANPSQSMQALTIGSICCGEYEDNDLISFGSIGAVSSFSRTGFGLWKSIKPEVVEAGGDWIRSKHNNSTFISNDEICPELIRRSPEGPAYAKDEGGTSFATPKVSYIAAQLQKTLPNEPGLLYKNLIVHSARWTDWAANLPDHEYVNVLRYMGYGLPNVERATTNDEHRITFITTGEHQIIGGDIHIYRVKIPNEIRALNAEIRVDVTLSFSASPRRTRKGFKGYFSTWVDWTSSKFNEDVQEFANRMLALYEDNDSEMESAALSKGIAWTIGAQDNHGKIKDISRSRSATQKDWAVMPAYTLPEEFCIAVVGHKGWCKNGEHFAKYALAVGFDAINRDADIYVPFSIQVEPEVETVTEIETEIEVRDSE